ASEIGLVVNDNDPQSVAVAAHYQKVRNIPDAHVYHVTFGTKGKAALGGTMTEADFVSKVQGPLAAQVDPSIQAYAVSFSGPNKVDCMSLTSALAFGFDKKYCALPGSQCGPGPGKPTATSSYYNSASFAPFTDAALRPAMMLAGTSVENVQALIDRGVSSDDTFPDGDGYFLRTTDVNRSARYADFQATVTKWASPGGPLTMTYLDNADGKGANQIKGEKDVLFYLTGLTTVPDIATNTYRPGAIADHLTSSGGGFGTSGQMSVLRWLEAGATASYGTVVEPCAYQQKFPRASVLVPHYFRGETLVEAYWKSVLWPGEGVFVGEPLARPWGTRTTWKNGTLTIATTTLVPGQTYAIESAPAATGPWATVQDGITLTMEQLLTLTVKGTSAPYYRLIAQ
ncbi:MAG: TIGR03790 family protein, partial [Myxococcales bacterium]